MTNRSVVIFSLVLTACILCAGTSTAWAEHRAGTFDVTPWLGGYAIDGDLPYDNGWTAGLSMGYNFTEKWGAELSFNYVDADYDGPPLITGTGIDFNDDDAAVYLYRFDVLYHLTGILPDEVVPYLAGGVGMTTYDPDRKGLDSDNDFILNYGGGLKYYLTRDLALRGDLRHVIDFNSQGSGNENNVLYAIGLTCEMGGKPKRAEVEPAAVPEPLSPPAQETAATPPQPSTPPPGEQGSIVFRNILFDFDKSDIKAESYPILDEVMDYLDDHTDIKMEIQGHTDSIGTAAYNMGLSNRRAASVKKYLVDKGIETTRLEPMGFGLTRPVAPNDSEENRAKNRRVEFKPIQ